MSYHAYEWDPSGGRLEELIELAGAESRYDAAGERQHSPKNTEEAFFPVGVLETAGTRVRLPYCWFSAVDTWNNPNLCAVNFYDLSGDRIGFTGSIVNRPDLLPVAKAIEYAQARDYHAVLAYCGSPDVARRMVRDVPIHVSAVAGLKITRIGPSRKRVEFEGEPALRFEVAKRGDRWIVTAFRLE